MQTRTGWPTAGRRLAEAQRIEDEFREGTLRWDRSEFNCADVVARILHAGGYGNDTLVDRLGLPAMPLDVFENARRVFEDDSSLSVNVVAYRQVPGSQTSYRFARFPLSLGQPLRSVARVLRDASSDPLELAVSKQVAAYFGDRRLVVDDLRLLGLSAEPGDRSRPEPERVRLELALGADLRRLLAARVKIPVKEAQETGIPALMQEIRGLVERGLETRGWRAPSVLAYFRGRHALDPAEDRAAGPSRQANGTAGYWVGDRDGTTPGATSTRSRS
jgi:processive 1,2-diacylglycerol beta-glucosyltransferase